MSISAITSSAATVANSNTGKVALSTGKAVLWTFAALKANSEASRNFLEAATGLDGALRDRAERLRENWNSRNSTEEENVA